MKKRCIIIILFSLTTALMHGCTSIDETSDNNQDVQYIPLGVKDETNQHISNEVKQILSEFEEITTIKAVNTPKRVIAAVEINHFKRFKLDKYKKKYIEAIGKSFPNMIIELSTDKKLVIEINRLEKAIKEKDISRQNLEIRVQKLIKLMRKKT